MSPNLRLHPLSFLNETKIKQSRALSTLVLVSVFVATSCLAQQSSVAQPVTHSPDPRSQDILASANPARDTMTITVPAGARIALVLMHPIQSRYVHRGDNVYAQTTSPVLAGNEVVIPPGTFVQGKVDRWHARVGAQNFICNPCR